MSRIAKIPVQIVKGVSYTLTNDTITVKGPVGEVSMHVWSAWVTARRPRATP